MKKNTLYQAWLVWLGGLLLFILRLVQLKNGFDPVTGLALSGSGIGPLAGHGVWIGTLLCFAAELLLCFRRPRDSKRSYACCFRTPEGPATGALTAGCFLLLAGGTLLLIGALPPRGGTLVTAAAGLLGLAGGAGLLLLVRKLRSEDAPPVSPLLPVMFFSVLFLLTVYFPEESNPVLARYWLPVLAAAMAAYFFYQLSGFFRSEGNLRWFGLVSSLAATTCIASAADCLRTPGRLLVFLGFAVTATVFPLLLREEPLPEPPGPEEDA